MIEKAPTYLLDENYYEITDRVAIETKQKMIAALEETIHSFTGYLSFHRIEQLRSDVEYGLELLYLGVLYLSYSKQEKSSYIERLDCLYQWLLQTKEFDEIAARIKNWLEYWRLDTRIDTDFEKVLELSGTFLEQSSKMLHQYVQNVPEFIRKAGLMYRDRDDYLFISRCENEYYINMVGAQILNHTYQQEFRKADKIYVFVPGCMAARLDKCNAAAGKMGYTCAKCTPSCPVNLTSQICDKYHAETVIIYHNSELYHTKVSSSGATYGVIGIACVLNLISGGLKARELGYIPQCVVLDYCGCMQHWCAGGLVTDINRNRLEQLLFGLY